MCLSYQFDLDQVCLFFFVLLVQANLPSYPFGIFGALVVNLGGSFFMNMSI